MNDLREPELVSRILQYGETMGLPDNVPMFITESNLSWGLIRRSSPNSFGRDTGDGERTEISWPAKIYRSRATRRSTTSAG